MLLLSQVLLKLTSSNNIVKNNSISQGLDAFSCLHDGIAQAKIRYPTVLIQLKELGESVGAK